MIVLPAALRSRVTVGPKWWHATHRKKRRRHYNTCPRATD